MKGMKHSEVRAMKKRQYEENLASYKPEDRMRRDGKPRKPTKCGKLRFNDKIIGNTFNYKGLDGRMLYMRLSLSMEDYLTRQVKYCKKHNIKDETHHQITIQTFIRSCVQYVINNHIIIY